MYRTMALACYRAGIKADAEGRSCGKMQGVRMYPLGYENGAQKV